MRKAVPVFAITLAALAPACASSHKDAASAEEARYSHQAPAGSRFRARLNTALGTAESTPGQPFTASIVTPISSARGDTVIPAGAMIQGRVIGVDQGPAASVQVVFTSVDAGKGPAPLAATIRKPTAPQARYSTEEIYTQGLPYSSVLLPARSQAPGPQSAVGGGPNPTTGSATGSMESSTAQPPGQQQSSVSLPVGTAIELVLTQPLEYPAASQSGSGLDSNDSGSH